LVETSKHFCVEYTYIQN